MERDKFSREKWADSIVRTIQRYLFAEITRITRGEQWCKVSLRRGPFTLLYFAILWDKNLSRSAKEGRDYSPRRSILSFPLSLVPSILVGRKKRKGRKKGSSSFLLPSEQKSYTWPIAFPFLPFLESLVIVLFQCTRDSIQNMPRNWSISIVFQFSPILVFPFFHFWILNE